MWLRLVEFEPSFVDRLDHGLVLEIDERAGLEVVPYLARVFAFGKEWIVAGRLGRRQRVAVLLRQLEALDGHLVGIGQVAAIRRRRVVLDGVKGRRAVARYRLAIAQELGHVRHRVHAHDVVELGGHHAAVALDGGYGRLLQYPLHLDVDARLENVSALRTHTHTHRKQAISSSRVD